MKYTAFLVSEHPCIFTALGVMIAVAFYWLRERKRTFYAIIEIVFGGITLFRSAPVTKGGAFDQSFDQFSFGGFTQVDYLTIVAAIYLIVRGFDNLNTGLHTSLPWKATRRVLRMDIR